MHATVVNDAQRAGVITPQGEILAEGETGTIVPGATSLERAIGCQYGLAA